MFIDLSYFYHFSLLQRLSYSPSRVSCFQKKKKKNHSTHGWAFRVFLGNIPSGLRRACLPVREKKQRPDGLLFSLIGWPHSLWNFGFSFTWLSVTSCSAANRVTRTWHLWGMRRDVREHSQKPRRCLPHVFLSPDSSS